MLERELERVLFTGVRDIGGLCYKFISNSSGVPDRIVIVQGKLYLIELKTKKGRLSPIQKKRISDIMNLYPNVRVLYGIDEVRQFLDEIRM